MALSSAQVAVGATPTLLSGSEGDRRLGQTAVVVNAGATALFLGGPAVTTATGVQLAAGASLPPLALDAGEALYAVSATTGTAHVLLLGL